MTYPIDEAFTAAMLLSGWEYVGASDGFKKGEAWVSYEQAERAFRLAEQGLNMVPRPVSERVADILVDCKQKVANR